jgi:hypothetical protein
MIPRTPRSWFLTIAAWLFGVAIGSVFGALVLVVLERTPPVQILAASDAGEIAAHDGRIFIHYKTIRTRMCNMETTRWLYTFVTQPDGTRIRTNVPVRDSGTTVPAADLGQSEQILSLELPDGLWPGEWFFQTDALDRCGILGDFAPTRRKSDPISIDVERARAVAGVPVVDQVTGHVRGRSPLGAAR